jgi:hypothetical protein
MVASSVVGAASSVYKKHRMKYIHRLENVIS